MLFAHYRDFRPAEANYRRLRRIEFPDHTRSTAELLAIPGIGISTVEKYGAQIYRVLDEGRR